jgi:hypothetical protein
MSRGRRGGCSVGRRVLRRLPCFGMWRSAERLDCASWVLLVDVDLNSGADVE